MEAFHFPNGAQREREAITGGTGAVRLPGKGTRHLYTGIGLEAGRLSGETKEILAQMEFPRIDGTLRPLFRPLGAGRIRKMGDMSQGQAQFGSDLAERRFRVW